MTVQLTVKQKKLGKRYIRKDQLLKHLQHLEKYYIAVKHEAQAQGDEFRCDAAMGARSAMTSLIAEIEFGSTSEISYPLNP